MFRMVESVIEIWQAAQRIPTPLVENPSMVTFTTNTLAAFVILIPVTPVSCRHH
jgi:hypothetical protein